MGHDDLSVHAGLDQSCERPETDLRFGVYAPTGEYEQGQLANIGKNYWTFEPGIMASWLSSKIGTEVSLYTGVDFNTENRTPTTPAALHYTLT